jgi:hypothetical protein
VTGWITANNDVKKKIFRFKIGCIGQSSLENRRIQGLYPEARYRHRMTRFLASIQANLVSAVTRHTKTDKQITMIGRCTAITKNFAENAYWEISSGWSILKMHYRSSNIFKCTLWVKKGPLNFCSFVRQVRIKVMGALGTTRLRGPPPSRKE